MSLSTQEGLEREYVMGTFARKPVQFVRGEGVRLFDDEGNEYLDFVAGIGVISVGHCHPRLTAALQKQAETLMHVSNYYYIEKRGEVARKLSRMLRATCPEDEGWKVFFSNSGAESNECAIKLARVHAKRRAEAEGKPAPRIIVTLERSFHGRTLASLAATAQPAKQELFQPLPDGFVATPLNDIAALEDLFAKRSDEICAILLEPIQGESGVHPCTAEFMAAARRLTRERGALLMCDEVQCGIFRCGEHPFGFQHLGVQPDVVSMAKGIAGGFPMGACAARASVADSFQPGDHGTTFGGSNLAIVSAYETLSIIEDEDLARNVQVVGAYLRSRLEALPQVVEVRGRGLMLAAELAEGIDAPGVVLDGLSAGLVLNYTGPSTLRFLPPLTCSVPDVDALIEKLSVLLANR